MQLYNRLQSLWIWIKLLNIIRKHTTQQVPKWINLDTVWWKNCILRILHRRRTQQSNHSNNTINYIRFYYRGLSLANVTTERFNTEVKDNLFPKDIEFLNTAFIDLRTRLNEKSTINEISGLSHGQIQPTLQRIFKHVLE